MAMLKRRIANILGTSAAFGRDQRGNFAILGAVLTPMLVMAAGFAVNVAHIYNARSSMMQALDVALTSTTRDVISKGMSKNAAVDSMNDYLGANGDVGLAEADQLNLVALDIDRAARTVHAQLQSDVRMPFAVFGFADSYPVVVDAKSAYVDRPVEVAMMLDLTGSMNDPGTPKNGRRQSKLDNLKDAASQAVTDLLARNRPGQKPRVRVALVPYSQGVNAGALAEASYIENGVIPTKPLGLSVLNNPQTALEKTIKAVQDQLRPNTDRCTTERKTETGKADLGDDAPDLATVNRAYGLAPNTCPAAEVAPLSADESMLLKQIRNFAGRGGTAGHIGVQWTRYVLSPKWADFLTAKVDADAAPKAVGTGPTAVRKVAILLTDGEFNTQYAPGNSASMAQAHCAALKGDVEVFTIGFMLADKGAKATMAACASPDKSGGVKHYYDASNAAELNAAFEAITSNTEVIRLTN